MVGASSPLRALHSLHAFSLKCPSLNMTSMKIKTLLHAVITSHICRLIRALTKAKSIFVANIKTKRQPIHFIYSTKKGKNTKNKIFFGSFRLHYNWCSSSHVMPVPTEPILDYTYYDASWNSIITEEQKHEDDNEAQLSGYLKWLEEKKVHANNPTDELQDVNEIDKLAEIFIANCHEKFILEKQESYRRFQEMLARSI